MIPTFKAIMISRLENLKSCLTSMLDKRKRDGKMNERKKSEKEGERKRAKRVVTGSWSSFGIERERERGVKKGED